MKWVITITLQFKETPLGIIKSKKIIKPVQFQHSKFTSVAGKCHGFYQGISMLFSICLSKKKKKKNAEATEFFEVLKNNFPKIRKYIFLFKKEKACFS